jgi:F420-non-reducing hydrogenase iron-sulfur subunit
LNKKKKKMNKKFKPTITVFYCINTLFEEVSLLTGSENNYELKTVKLPCSGMVKDVFLLKAFEAGADAVVVLVCPEEQCRFVQGSIRARKRVEWVQNLLDEIGLSGRRLSILNLSPGGRASSTEIISKALADLDELGPNPAA